MDASVDGLDVRLSGQPEDRLTRTIHNADIHDQVSGEWLATAFRLTAGEAAADLYTNHRRRTEIAPRRELLLKSVFEFQAAIRAGEVNACLK